ncbi:hypothetical protein VOLCADRAFT_127338 [Volvox carteri f. nagariensis]|uniref:Uncharacterized protein n=1 Tax=Volvox carteri f. nagariensis TaxID=3068 RepID=D8THW3_VOLCA|nr:uncharacterized protein VOLCADRAFT_127338 [Volvox carteri f. nagariensis]EFJ52785.1 hypothetical protein VOLCADRAFT_127338 [Volvox carteri f. nagariensis]|eukprot:XP_002945790.1 hypothetical protein VOLCADRAFT_127338 [Volvox carteri f. nagariensis]
MNDSDNSNTEKNIVEPIHVVVAGSTIAGIGAVVTATLTYRAGTKDLIDDGINPGSRLRIIPVAARALALSTVLTGLLGFTGYYVLKEQGFFSTDRAELPSVKEAADVLRNPRDFISQFSRSTNERKCGQDNKLSHSSTA